MTTSIIESKPDQIWQKTPIANLVRNAASGIYYARARIKGKLIWKSLKADTLTVAKLRLGDFLKQEQKQAEISEAAERGRMTFGEALAIFKKRLEASHHLKANSKKYRHETIKALLKTWPSLENTDVRKISAADCKEWADEVAAKYSSTRFNNMVGTLRMILKMAADAGARHTNPASDIKKAKVRQKILRLPEQSQFPALVQAIRNAGGRFSQDCGDFAEFLAYSGARLNEAARVNGCDCDFENEKITIKGDLTTGTKNWETRTLPMIADLKRLLERIRSNKTETEWAENPVIGVRECQKAINSACEKLGISRFTHHDLRHLFATRCIESGVDIPTVSRWLGHKDGGALAMKTYGHLRDEHSTTMAKKVVFANAPTADANANVPQKSVNDQSVGVDRQIKTIAQAKATYSYPWWASTEAMEIFYGQANEAAQIVPVAKFLQSAKAAMGREVFEQELDEPQALLDELIERVGVAVVEKVKLKISGNQKASVA